MSKRRGRAPVSSDEGSSDASGEDQVIKAEDIDGLSYADLRGALKRRGIVAKGKKDSLKAQLVELLHAHGGCDDTTE